MPNGVPSAARPTLWKRLATALTRRRQCSGSSATTRAARDQAGGIYRVLVRFAGQVGIDVDGFGPHALRATAFANALDNKGDLGKVQMWVGHANISTPRIYDHREEGPEDSSTFKFAC
ncbi:tyrosine-type recombinase/integrase [Massilia sp. IC2-278]|nr:tyrosine-type recombinase/integrase [Massilia sp. IC2-278]